LPLIEAMASGCPALVPNTGGCPELGSTAARYVNPLDREAIGKGMLELETSTELKAAMRKAGLERAHLFSWERTAESTLKVFDQICRCDIRKEEKSTKMAKGLEQTNVS
jgi:glycosyltransferase involved in cell wall biosynthesis